MTDLLHYTEVQYAAYCACRDRPMAELKAYFGTYAAEQMERRYQAEHCSECGVELEEREANRDVPMCDDCNDALPSDDCPDMRYVAHWNAFKAGAR